MISLKHKLSSIRHISKCMANAAVSSLVFVNITRGKHVLLHALCTFQNFHFQIDYSLYISDQLTWSSFSEKTLAKLPSNPSQASMLEKKTRIMHGGVLSRFSFSFGSGNGSASNFE